MKRKIPTLRITLLLLSLLMSISCMGTWRLDLCGQMVAISSFHGRYVTAMGEDDDWALRQEEELGPCGWFNQRRLEDGRITLETCHGRYVTAPTTGTTSWDWRLRQEPEPGDCGRFVVHDLGSDGVAFETCAEHFFTAGDGNWPGKLAWSLVGETDQLQDWECFTVLQR